MKPPSGVIGEDGVEIQRVPADVTSRRRPPRFRPSLHVYEFDWSPDRTVAYVAADPPGENNWWVAASFIPSVASRPGPRTPKLILAPSDVPAALHGLQIAVPRWSPDGKIIAFIGGLMSDQGVTGGDVWLVSSLAAATPRDLTPGTPHLSRLDRVGDRRLPLCERACGREQPTHSPAPAGRPHRQTATSALGRPSFRSRAQSETGA